MATAALAIVGVAGCSSPSPPLPGPRAGGLPAGTAEVKIGQSDTLTTDAVDCLPLGLLTKIAIGDPGAGVDVMVDNASALTAKSVAINNVGGFTGSYWYDLQGTVRVGMVDQTYTFSGTASGFSADDPTAVTTKPFTVKVAC